MKKYLFTLCVLIFGGCKLNKGITEVQESTGVGNISAGTERNYTTSELEIGRRICSNLKKKREYFSTLNENSAQVRFKAELRTCDNTIYKSDLFVATISNAGNSGPEYVASRDTYFRDVLTDQNGSIKTLCDSLNTQDSVSNTTTTGNFKYISNLLIADGLDRLEITKKKKNSDGTYTAISAEAASFFSQKIQAPTKFFGVEKERIRYTQCTGKNFSTISQTWVEAVSDF